MKKLFTQISRKTSRSVLAGVVVAGVLGSAASLVIAQGTAPVKTASFIEQNTSLSKIGSLSLGRDSNVGWLNSSLEGASCLRQNFDDESGTIDPETCLDVLGQSVFDYLAVDGQVNTLTGVNIGQSAGNGTDAVVKLSLNDTGDNNSLLATNLARYTDGDLLNPSTDSPSRNVCVNDNGVIILCGSDTPVPDAPEPPETYTWVLGELGECSSTSGVSSCTGTYPDTTPSCLGSYSTPGTCAASFDVLGGQFGSTVVGGSSAQLGSANSFAECQDLFNAYLASNNNFQGASATNHEIVYSPPSGGTTSCSRNQNANRNPDLCESQHPNCSHGERDITRQCSGFNTDEASCTGISSCTWNPAVGERSAEVTCQNSSGEVVDDVNCTDVKPSESVACGNAVTFAWDTEITRACPSSSSRTRCVENPNYLDYNLESYRTAGWASPSQTSGVNPRYLDGTVAGADRYTAHTIFGRPSSSKLPCEEYSGTSSCNRQGDRCKLIAGDAPSSTRNVTCLGSDGNIYGDEYCQDSGVKPARSVSCPGLIKTWSDGSDFEWDSNAVYDNQKTRIGTLASFGFGGPDSQCSPGQTGRAIANIDTPFGAAAWFFPALLKDNSTGFYFPIINRRANPAYAVNWTNATCNPSTGLWEVPCDLCDHVDEFFESDQNSRGGIIHNFTLFPSGRILPEGEHGNAYRER